MRKLTNKQVVVLELLREKGALTCNDIAETITHRTPCSLCDGTGGGDHPRFGCPKCYGRGRAVFCYSVAYQCLKTLRNRGLVVRRFKRDEWGDELPTHIYEAAPIVREDDPLEALWTMPATRGAEASD